MSYPLFHPKSSEPPHADLAAEFARAFPGEDEYVEFKQGLSEVRMAEAVTAFSNADGGVILLGVNPHGTPIGIDVGGEAQARVLRTARSRTSSGYFLTPELGEHSR
jgi:ATP-dependent DNA helicase RecG